MQKLSEDCDAPGHRPSRFGIRTWLAMFALAVALPLLIFAGVTLQQLATTERQATLAELDRQTEGVAADINRFLLSLQNTATMFSHYNSARDGDFQTFYNHAIRDLPQIGTGFAVTLADRDGRILISTRRPLGQAMPTVGDVKGLSETLSSQKPHIGGLFIGSLTQLPAFSVAAPVVQDGQINSVVFITVSAMELTSILREERLPAGWIGTVDDADGIILARTVAPETWIGTPALSAAAAAKGSPRGTYTLVNKDGVEVSASFVRVPASGWTVILAVPTAQLRGPADRSRWFMLALGLTALALAGLLALAVGRRMSRQVASIAHAAASIGHGPLPMIMPSRVREFRDVASALARASAERGAMEHDLRNLTESLEERVRQEVAAREEAQGRLAHAQRMEALGQLAGGIAHDFNNVLQAVQGGASLIQRRAEDADRARSLARMIVEAAGRGAAITRRLLAFSRRGDLRAEPLEVASLLGDMQEILSHTLGAGITVRTEIEPGLPPLLADKGQLETVLINLATNARDAMQGTGTLTMAACLDVLRHDDGPHHPVTLQAGTYVRLSVCDTGAGMTPEVLARASEPFFTTKAVGKGTGLGLAMARGFAEQSDGGLHIESEPGQGAVVKLWFPVAETEAPAAPNPMRATAAGIQQSRPRLLMVDDDPIVLATLTMQMEAEGYAVVQAPRGIDALARLDRGEVFDLVISDLSMPGMSGLAFIQEVQRRLPGLPAILLTGFATEGAEFAIGGATSSRYTLLRKPIDAQTLAERAAVMLEEVGASSR